MKSFSYSWSQHTRTLHKVTEVKHFPVMGLFTTVFIPSLLHQQGLFCSRCTLYLIPILC